MTRQDTLYAPIGVPGGPLPWQKYLAWQNRKQIDSLAEKNWKAQ